ncbi:hypothetical protein D3C73_935510 [compost metagenome]
MIRDLISRLRMPGQCSVNIVEEAVSRHQAFSPTAFLGRTTVKAYRTGKSGLLQVVADSDRCGKRTCSEQIMSAAMSVPSLDNGLLRDLPAVLAKPEQGIVFPKNGDNRLSAAIAPDDSSFNIACSTRDLEALLLQNICHKRG